MSPRPSAVQRRLGGQLRRHLARLRPGSSRDSRRCARGSRRPSRSARGRACGTRWRPSCSLPCRPRGKPTRAQRRRATRTSELRNQSVTGKLSRTIHSSGSSRAPSRSGRQPPSSAGLRRQSACQRPGDEARRRRAARSEARQGEQPPGRSTRRASANEGGGVGRAEQVEHVGADDPVAGGVRDREAHAAVGELDAGALGPRRDRGARQVGHVRTDVEPQVAWRRPGATPAAAGRRTVPCRSRTRARTRRARSRRAPRARRARGARSAAARPVRGRCGRRSAAPVPG